MPIAHRMPVPDWVPIAVRWSAAIPTDRRTDTGLGRPFRANHRAEGSILPADPGDEGSIPVRVAELDWLGAAESRCDLRGSHLAEKEHQLPLC
jgi:hypothetical protein